MIETRMRTLFLFKFGMQDPSTISRLGRQQISCRMLCWMSFRQGKTKDQILLARRVPDVTTLCVYVSIHMQTYFVLS